MLTFSLIGMEGSFSAVSAIGGALPGSDGSLTQTDATAYAPQAFSSPETPRDHATATGEEAGEAYRPERQGLSPWGKVRAAAGVLLDHGRHAMAHA